MEAHDMMHVDPANTIVAISPDDTLNAIVARYPQVLPVLQRFGLDTCCGGALPLRVAAQHHDLDAAAVLAALQALVKGEGE
jgi:regulator of cell morphogenesis and NO signaling